MTAVKGKRVTDVGNSKGAVECRGSKDLNRGTNKDVFDFCSCEAAL